MAILTVNIDTDKDLPALREILNLFGLNYTVTEEHITAADFIKAGIEVSEKELLKLHAQVVALFKE